MRYQHSAQSRAVIDSRLHASKNELRSMQKPQLGWIRTVREALSMSQSQLAKRLGVTQRSVQSMEKSEASEGIRLQTLRRAADALGCDLVYALVPREPLGETMERQARWLVASRLAAVNHSMLLEDQAVNSVAQDIDVLLPAVLTSGTAIWQEDGSRDV
ncbi:MAG: mobile mystery protein A [Candidatus Nanopelagicales bacterium]